jgi:hypothetical protein
MLVSEDGGHNGYLPLLQAETSCLVGQSVSKLDVMM